MTEETLGKLTLDQQLEFIQPYAQKLGTSAFIDVFPPEEGEEPQPSHIALLDPDETVSLDDYDLCEGGRFFKDAFFLQCQEMQQLRKQQKTEPTCFDRRGRRAEVLYRGEGINGHRTVLARVYDQGETDSGQLWNGEERVFDLSWKPRD